jgi:mannose-6-phosphate isomerase-like protein (cupin superfamily)
MKEHELTTGVEVKTHHPADDGTFLTAGSRCSFTATPFEVIRRTWLQGSKRLFAGTTGTGLGVTASIPFSIITARRTKFLAAMQGRRACSSEEGGAIEEVCAGDVVIIPAGVAHKNLGASRDFGVVGAYPAGQDYDMNYGKHGERPRVDENIARVPLPESDPVFGSDGPLLNYWKL